MRGTGSGERRVLQIDANVNSGNSGGPVINKDGFVVGVVRASLKDASGIAFAIPIGELDTAEKLDWHAASTDRRVPVPVGWIVEPGAPTPCAGLSNPGSAGTAAPARDFTVALRVAIWPGGVVPEDPAAKCSAQRGSLGQTSYSRRADWLGLSYAIEGVFVRVGSQIIQLEVLGPDQRSAYTRALLAAWARRVE